MNSMTCFAVYAPPLIMQVPLRPRAEDCDPVSEFSEVEEVHCLIDREPRKVKVCLIYGRKSQQQTPEETGQHFDRKV